MTFPERGTLKKLSDAYIFPQYSHISTQNLQYCSSYIAVISLEIKYNLSKKILFMTKKIGQRGQLSYLGQHLRKICDYLSALISKINLISLRGGITGPLSELRRSQDGWETSPEYILTCSSDCPLHSSAYGVNRINPKKTSNSDDLKPNQRALRYPRQDLHSHLTDRFISNRY